MEAHTGFELFEHTADIGLLARGRTLAELFVHAAEGLVDVTVDPAGLEETVVVPVHVTAPDREGLLVAWLNELLFLLDTRRFLPRRVMIEHLSETEVRAELRGGTVDPERHTVRRMVKAATYHQASIRETPEGWEARVILDL
jgi:SHS2 domain-containing protein